MPQPVFANSTRCCEPARRHPHKSNKLSNYSSTWQALCATTTTRSSLRSRTSSRAPRHRPSAVHHRRAADEPLWGFPALVAQVGQGGPRRATGTPGAARSLPTPNRHALNARRTIPNSHTVPGVGCSISCRFSECPVIREEQHNSSFVKRYAFPLSQSQTETPLAYSMKTCRNVKGECYVT